MRKREGIEPRNLLKMSEAEAVHLVTGRSLVAEKKERKARIQEPDGV